MMSEWRMFAEYSDLPEENVLQVVIIDPSTMRSGVKTVDGTLQFIGNDWSQASCSDKRVNQCRYSSSTTATRQLVTKAKLKVSTTKTFKVF